MTLVGVGKCGDTRHPKGLPLTQKMNYFSSLAYLLHAVGSTKELATIFKISLVLFGDLILTIASLL